MLPEIRSSTRVCALFGFPVEHSFSPRMQNTAFAHLGLDFVYVPFLVHPEKLEQATQAIRALNLAGVNVTVPHKEKIIPFLDEISPGAELTGAVNTIVNKNGKLTGYNTDGAGFLRSLEEDAGFMVQGKRFLILGAGGGARAIAVALAGKGARKIFIVNRTLQKAVALANEINMRLRADASAVLWTEKDLTDILPGVDAVVNCTSIGMRPDVGNCPSFPFEYLQSGQLVYDLVYNPPLTKFLKRARDAGAKICGGLGMLLGQGALAFELWTSKGAPVTVMRRALEELIN
jgi:shikimate dehydrogenase